MNANEKKFIPKISDKSVTNGRKCISLVGMPVYANKWYSYKQLADGTGENIRTIRNWVNSKGFKKNNIGRTVMVHGESIITMLEKN